MHRKHTAIIHAAVAVAAALGIASCGGAGSSAGKTGGDPGPARYALGGQVTGLTGTLVLQNDGWHDLTIAQAGPFQFPMRLPDGMLYDVTIKASPAGQDCQLANGIGRIAGAAVTGIAVTCTDKVVAHTWTNPVSVIGSTADTTAPSSPGVAIDGAGDALVVWLQSPTSDGSTTYQVYQAEERGGAWTRPASAADTVNVPNGFDGGQFPMGGPPSVDLAQRVPRVAADATGSAIVAWSQYDGTAYRIYRAEYRGGRWTRSRSLADFVPIAGLGAAARVDAAVPQVAMDGQGNAIVAWVQFDGTTFHVFESEYRGGAWHDPASLADAVDATGNVSLAAPGVGMDAQGNAVITWEAFTGGRHQLWKRERRGGQWLAPDAAPVSVPGLEVASASSRLAMAPGGDAVLVWVQTDQQSTGGLFRCEAHGAAWSCPAAASDAVEAGVDVTNPRVAMGGNGDAIVTWQAQDAAGLTQVRAGVRRAGAWDAPVALSSATGFPGASSPSVAMDGAGQAVVTWAEPGTGFLRAELRGGAPAIALVHPGGQHTWGAAAPAAMNAAGKAVIAWGEHLGLAFDVLVTESP